MDSTSERPELPLDMPPVWTPDTPRSSKPKEPDKRPPLWRCKKCGATSYVKKALCQPELPK